MSNRLSKQQQRRIKRQHNERLDGQAIEDAAIVVAHMGYETIVDDNGELLAADWRKSLGDIAVNDRVLLSRMQGERAVIEAVFPRQHTLYKWHGRKAKAIATHIDQLVVVIAARPQWQASLLDRYIIAARQADINLTIVCNKIDLLTDDAYQQWQDELQPYRAMGYRIMALSVANEEGLSEISDILAGKQTVICGQSGVGKSSMINKLVPDSDIWIQSLSEATDLGRHTTTNSRRYPLTSGGAVIDTPGVRGFSIDHLNTEEIIAGFKDIASHTGDCRFNDCSHRHEPGCAVLEAVAAGAIAESRYHSLMQILEEHST
ncbi:ribosome small subunit-dependent GTPase A [Cardiobacteriaceae bacterium TAE3-ERU3]|nr:ribosome small subunit-dependent GTPase A [Cardiobacteriaceae bacterium TAE3-ERU3]